MNWALSELRGAFAAVGLIDEVRPSRWAHVEIFELHRRVAIFQGDNSVTQGEDFSCADFARGS